MPVDRGTLERRSKLREFSAGDEAYLTLGSSGGGRWQAVQQRRLVISKLEMKQGAESIGPC